MKYKESETFESALLLHVLHKYKCSRSRQRSLFSASSNPDLVLDLQQLVHLDEFISVR